MISWVPSSRWLIASDRISSSVISTRLAPRFSMQRAVIEYVEDYYLPATDTPVERAAA